MNLLCIFALGYNQKIFRAHALGKCVMPTYVTSWLPEKRALLSLADPTQRLFDILEACFTAATPWEIRCRSGRSVVSSATKPLFCYFTQPINSYDSFAD